MLSRTPNLFAMLLLVTTAATLQAQNPLEWLFDRDRLPELFENRRGREFEAPRGQRRANAGLRATEQGKGTLGMRGPNRTLQQASVVLDQNGTAQFVFRGEKDYSFGGKWRRAAANKVLVTIDSTYGRVPASGTGTITLDNGGSFVHVDLTGRSTALDGNFNVRFQVGGEDRRREARFSMDASERGRGSIGVSGPNRRLSQARVILQRDGDARLQFYGDASYEFVGTWSQRGQQIIDLRITRGPGNVRMTANGTVTLNKRGFSRVEILGQSQALGGRVRVSFDASGRQHVDGRYRGGTDHIDGRGSIGLRGPNKALNHADVTLARNGNVTLRLLGRGADFTIEGTWFGGNDPNTLHIEIDRVGDYRGAAVGTGVLTLSRGQVVAIDARGRAQGAGGDFRVTFRAGQAGYVDPRQRDPHDDHAHADAGHGRLPTFQCQQQTGTGRYQSNASNATLTNASVNLSSDGRATLSFSGRNTYRFTGTWGSNREGVVQLRLATGPRGVAVTGSGTLEVRGNRLISARLSGSSRSRGSFQLSFQEPRRSGGPFRRSNNGTGKTFQWRLNL